MRLRLLACTSAIAVGCASLSARAQETTTYQYDSLGRLVQSNVNGNPHGNAATGYTLDAAGNRTNVATSVTPAPTPTPGCVIEPYDTGFTLVKYGSAYSGSAQVIIAAPGCSSAVTLAYSTQSGTAVSGVHFAATTA